MAIVSHVSSILVVCGRLEGAVGLIYLSQSRHPGSIWLALVPTFQTESGAATYSNMFSPAPTVLVDLGQLKLGDTDCSVASRLTQQVAELHRLLLQRGRSGPGNAGDGGCRRGHNLGVLS